MKHSESKIEKMVSFENRIASQIIIKPAKKSGFAKNREQVQQQVEPSEDSESSSEEIKLEIKESRQAEGEVAEGHEEAAHQEEEGKDQWREMEHPCHKSLADSIPAFNSEDFREYEDEEFDEEMDIDGDDEGIKNITVKPQAAVPIDRPIFKMIQRLGIDNIKEVSMSSLNQRDRTKIQRFVF